MDAAILSPPPGTTLHPERLIDTMNKLLVALGFGMLATCAAATTPMPTPAQACEHKAGEKGLGGAEKRPT
jgi:hypothetical protein